MRFALLFLDFALSFRAFIFRFPFAMFSSLAYYATTDFSPLPVPKWYIPFRQTLLPFPSPCGRCPQGRPLPPSARRQHFEKWGRVLPTGGGE
jgi:hypothetical protein